MRSTGSYLRSLAAGFEQKVNILFLGCREWAGKLPTGKSESDQARRDELFQQFDPNGNGYLSLAEVDKGVHDILGLEVRGWAWLACFGGMQATEEGCDAAGSVQMQACDHEGVSSCERDPHGDWIRGLFWGVWRIFWVKRKSL